MHTVSIKWSRHISECFTFNQKSASLLTEWKSCLECHLQMGPQFEFSPNFNVGFEHQMKKKNRIGDVAKEHKKNSSFFHNHTKKQRYPHYQQSVMLNFFRKIKIHAVHFVNDHTSFWDAKDAFWIFWSSFKYTHKKKKLQKTRNGRKIGKEFEKLLRKNKGTK